MIIWIGRFQYLLYHCYPRLLSKGAFILDLLLYSARAPFMKNPDQYGCRIVHQSPAASLISNYIYLIVIANESNNVAMLFNFHPVRRRVNFASSPHSLDHIHTWRQERIVGANCVWNLCHLRPCAGIGPEHHPLIPESTLVKHAKPFATQNCQYSESTSALPLVTISPRSIFHFRTMFIYFSRNRCRPRKLGKVQ